MKKPDRNSLALQLSNSKPQQVRELIQRDPSLLDHRNKEGQTPLHTAVIFGRIEGERTRHHDLLAIEVMLNMGANVDAKSNDGRTALWIATDQGNLVSHVYI